MGAVERSTHSREVEALIDRLETPELTLRPFRKSDRIEYIRMHHISADHFQPWMPKPVRKTGPSELFDDELARAAKGRESGGEVRWTAELRDGALAGVFSLTEIVRGAFQNAYAGWRVSFDQIGRGIATTAVTALLDLAFAPEPTGLGLHRVQANIIPANAASLRVAEKTGFRREGLARAYLKINGTWQDHLMFAKLADEHEPRFLNLNSTDRRVEE